MEAAPEERGDMETHLLRHDAAARKLTETSIYKYKLLARQMDAFTERGGYCLS